MKVAAQDSELEGIKELALSGNDSVASFVPNKTTIVESELNREGKKTFLIAQLTFVIGLTS